MKTPKAGLRLRFIFMPFDRQSTAYYIVNITPAASILNGVTCSGCLYCTTNYETIENESVDVVVYSKVFAALSCQHLGWKHFFSIGLDVAVKCVGECFYYRQISTIKHPHKTFDA